MTICKTFQSPFDRRLHTKFKENWPRGFRGEVNQRYEQTTEGRTDDGRRRGVLTIANPEPLAQVCYKCPLTSYKSVILYIYTVLIVLALKQWTFKTTLIKLSKIRIYKAV